MTLRSIMRNSSLALLAALAAACGGSSGDTTATADAGDVFVAFGADFQDFRSWQSFDVTKDAAPGTVHPDARLIEYLNQTPPHGSTEFPVGTIIVKEGTELPVVGRQYFAMVKRGGGFNASGATNWEWFELRNLENGTVGIVWRGVGPPAGEVYGGDPTAGCNTCHVTCGNDSVCAKAVQLAQF